MTEARDKTEIDARGLECPVPTQQAVEAMRHARAAGTAETLVVQLDDAVCAADIPHHANALGYDAESERVAGPQWTITLRPRNAAPAGQQQGE
jgi:TusA-related sulfurtransferase